MTHETVPADIAAAIEAFERAVHSDAYCPGGSVDETRAALDAAIIRRIRGYETWQAELVRQNREMKAALERIEQGV